MNLSIDLSIASQMKSKSRIAGVVTEGWIASNGYCLACDADELHKKPTNNKIGDFYCPKCNHEYELKAVKKHRPSSILDGDFKAMMEKIESGSQPSLLLLERTESWQVKDLLAIHSGFLMPNAIQKRKPLGPNARRAGWTGCNILLKNIGTDADVEIIADGIVLPIKKVRERFARFLPIARKSVEQRGWTLLTLRMVRGLGKNEFALADVYELETQFAKAYPQNKHVKDKIRQQLQILRDLGVVEFVSRGEYRLID